MEEEEEKYNEKATNKQDEIIDTWMDTLKNTRGAG